MHEDASMAEERNGHINGWSRIIFETDQDRPFKIKTMTETIGIKTKTET